MKIDYNQVNKDINRLNKLINEEKFYNQFTCNYCPSTGHKLCTHKDKCLMNETILDIVCEISRVNKRIKWIKTSHVGLKEEITLQKLYGKKRELYRQYNSIETISGGDVK